MVKKLFKHEIFAYVRTLSPLYAVLIGIALMARILQLFENSSTAYKIINGSSIFVYVIAIIICILLTLVFGVVRFYKNLFTGEGYLSFTLPVTPAQHITVKLVTSVMFQLISIITVLISVAVITAGDVFTEALKAIDYLWKMGTTTLGNHLPWYAVELIIAIITALFCEYLLFYTCISVGQLFHKNRIIAAIGVYFGYYVAVQIVEVIILVLGIALKAYLPYEELLQLIGKHPHTSAHIIICGITVFYLVLTFIYFVITNNVIRKRLNLE